VAAAEPLTCRSVLATRLFAVLVLGEEIPSSLPLDMDDDTSVARLCRVKTGMILVVRKDRDGADQAAAVVRRTNTIVEQKRNASVANNPKIR